MQKLYSRKTLGAVFLILILAIILLIGRLSFLMIGKADYYGVMARALHERERLIKGARGMITDRNGEILADNILVCSISVIHSQVENPQQVIDLLSQKLNLDKKKVEKAVLANTVREKIKSNVDKSIAEEIRAYHLPGVMIDEDYKRWYPYGSLASKVLGFTGADNQGIIGLEVEYDQYLRGTQGKILTVTTAGGKEVEEKAETRQEPVAGATLTTSLDLWVQRYCNKLCEELLEVKEAKSVRMVVMNPQNGEILGMADVPEFDCNDPFALEKEEMLRGERKEIIEKKQNEVWRNGCINDTYEPGSTFKIITAASALDAGVVSLKDTFFCPGYERVEDRKIRCAKEGGHGSQTFQKAMENSCNPAFMRIGAKLGANAFYDYLEKFGLKGKTGIDLPGEAGPILHPLDQVGAVELATMSFGQSFQITPIALMAAASAAVNGGHRITPHLALKIVTLDGTTLLEQSHPKPGERVIQEETSRTMDRLLESVVANGTGKNAYVEGLSIGGKTATSETLPRSARKYLSSFLGFAPASAPQVMALVIIEEPTGIFYGGTIAAPSIGSLMKNIVPYLIPNGG